MNGGRKRWKQRRGKNHEKNFCVANSLFELTSVLIMLYDALDSQSAANTTT